MAPKGSLPCWQEPLTVLSGAVVTTAWWVPRWRMEYSCEYIEKALMDNWEGVILQLGLSFTMSYSWRNGKHAVTLGWYGPKFNSPDNSLCRLSISNLIEKRSSYAKTYDHTKTRKNTGVKIRSVDGPGYPGCHTKSMCNICTNRGSQAFSKCLGASC
jgi:hypothetical protein